MKTTGWSKTILATVFLGALAPRAQAASITWSGSVNNIWDVNVTANWTGAATTVFNNGDNVTFNDAGANVNPVSISGTVQPGLKIFANTGAKAYRLDNGTLAGADNLVVSGGGNVSFGNPAGGTGTTPPVLTFAGDTVITNGSRLGFFHQTTGGPLSQGTGTIIVNGGYFGLHNTGNGQNYSFSNNLTIGSDGGTVSFNGNGASESSYMPTLTGTLRLEGNLDHAPRNTIFGVNRLGNGFNDNRGVIFAGTVDVIDSNRRLRFVDGPYPGGRTPWSTLRLSNAPMNLNGHVLTLDLNGTTQTTFALSGVTVNGPGTLAIAAGDQYSFADVVLAGSAGVLVAATAEVRLSSGIYSSSNFTWGAGCILNLGNNSTGVATLDVGAGMTFGTAADQVETFRLAPRGGDSGFSVVINGPLTFDSGSTMEFHATDAFRDRYNAGTIRFLDGSTIRFAGNQDNMGIGNSGGSAVIAFGDGDSNTAETITISGRSGTFIRPAGGFNTNDTGTSLRYTSTANVFRGYATSETRGAPQAINLPFLAGPAGTEFAPAAGTTFDARGPATGRVFTVSAPTALTTAATVRFMNSGFSDMIGSPGPVVVGSNGSLVFEAAGTVTAGDMIFKPGSVLSVRLTGDSPTACSLVDVSGTLTFESGTLIVITEDEGLPTAYKGPWHVAKGETLVGLPKKTAGPYSVTTAEGYVRIDRLASGTMILLR